MNKRALRFKRLTYAGVITLLLLTGCQQATAKESLIYNQNDSIATSKEQKDDSALLDNETQEYNTDHGYKLLYGSWSVEAKIAENYRLDIQDVSDVIGKEFMFSREKCNFYYQDEEVEVNYPEYKIVIIPLNEQTTYFPYMPTMNEIGITGNYITLFTVGGGYDIYFILKDDESLIMFYKDAYLELKRINHIEGYDAFYHSL